MKEFKNITHKTALNNNIYSVIRFKQNEMQKPNAIQQKIIQKYKGYTLMGLCVAGKAYLRWVEYNSSQSHPTVQAVHIGDILSIVKIKHSHQRNDS